MSSPFINIACFHLDMTKKGRTSLIIVCKCIHGCKPAITVGLVMSQFYTERWLTERDIV